MKIINKNVGYTPNQLRLKLINNNQLSKKSCFAGRLDPMARGAMIFLENEELKNMNYYLNKSKIYEFEIILGLSTDTDDILGLFDKIPKLLYDFDKIKMKICKIIADLKINGQQIQKYHPYSSYLLRKNDIKKPLWKWKSENNLSYDEIPTKNVNLYDIDILSYDNYNYKYLLYDFVNRINKIDKQYDFRQKDIITQWNTLLNKNLVDNFFSIKIRMKVSSGYYIRQFGYDLKTNIDFPLLIFDINRTNFI